MSCLYNTWLHNTSYDDYQGTETLINRVRVYAATQVICSVT